MLLKLLVITNQNSYKGKYFIETGDNICILQEIMILLYCGDWLN